MQETCDKCSKHLKTNTGSHIQVLKTSVCPSWGAINLKDRKPVLYVNIRAQKGAQTLTRNGNALIGWNNGTRSFCVDFWQHHHIYLSPLLSVNICSDAKWNVQTQNHTASSYDLTILALRNRWINILQWPATTWHKWTNWKWRNIYLTFSQVVKHYKIQFILARNAVASSENHSSLKPHSKPPRFNKNLENRNVRRFPLCVSTAQQLARLSMIPGEKPAAHWCCTLTSERSEDAVFCQKLSTVLPLCVLCWSCAYSLRWLIGPFRNKWSTIRHKATLSNKKSAQLIQVWQSNVFFLYRNSDIVLHWLKSKSRGRY